MEPEWVQDTAAELEQVRRTVEEQMSEQHIAEEPEQSRPVEVIVQEPK